MLRFDDATAIMVLALTVLAIVIAGTAAGIG
jgi:hypothetical protein